MASRWNRYLVMALFGVATLAAGCAARDVDVSQGARSVEKLRAQAKGTAAAPRQKTIENNPTGAAVAVTLEVEPISSSGPGSASGNVREGS